MSLPKHNRAQAKQQHLPYQSYNKLIPTTRNVRLWFWRLHENWPSRYTFTRVIFSLSIDLFFVRVLQIQKVVLALGDYMGVSCHACIGGTNVRDDMKRLDTGVQIVVGTPGRVFDMLSRSALRMLINLEVYDWQGFFHLGSKSIKMFVLDEADEMLSRGFKEQIYDVFTTMPEDVQVILLSATMPSDVLEVTTKFMNDPIKILVKREELTLEGIRQFYVSIEREVRHLFHCLRRIISNWYYC